MDKWWTLMEHCYIHCSSYFHHFPINHEWTNHGKMMNNWDATGCRHAARIKLRQHQPHRRRYWCRHIASAAMRKRPCLRKVSIAIDIRIRRLTEVDFILYHLSDIFWNATNDQWEFQDPKMEVYGGTLPYKVIYFVWNIPYIGLKHRPLVYTYVYVYIYIW